MASALDAVGSLFGMVHEDVRLRLTIKDVDEGKMKVASFTAVEGLSRPYEYAIVVATDPGDVAVLEAKLGAEATFFVERETEKERVVHGIVTEVLPDGAYVGKNQVRTTIVVEPRLANLRYSGGFRIFQKQTIKEIAETFLGPEQVTPEWRVRPDPEAREYRTQQDESDLDFLTRLLADEGIHYFFEHAEAESKLVFTNAPGGFTDIGDRAEIDFRDPQGAATGEHVRTIRRAVRVRTGAVEHRDYDFTQPRVPLQGRIEMDDGTPRVSKKRELREYPGAFVDPTLEDPSAGGNLETIAVARAEMRLQELRGDAIVLTGTASTLRLSAGRTFTLKGHRDKAFDRKLLVTEVSFGAAVQGTLWEQSGGARGSRAEGAIARFRAVPAETPIRPARRRKPASRLQTARVVGPADGDPFVDDFGRIKVQFMWDRLGAFDKESSCFIRMMTPVAHGDEGFYSAHKVGSEVLVDFLDGDIDRPVVLGALYNGREQTPYKLKDEVSKSSWKVKSIPGGKGYNEFTFENQAGKEQIILHAQKDLNEHVLHAHSETIGASQTSSVGGAQTVSVGGAQSISVGGSRTVTVKHAETITITEKRAEKVDGGEEVTIKSGRTHTIATGDDALSVSAGNRSVTVKQAASFQSKSKTENVETTIDVNAGEKISIHHKDDAALEIKAGEATLGTTQKIVLSNPSGTVTLADGKVTIAAKDELVLGAGAAKITLKKDGTVAIEGAKEVGLACNASTLKLEPATAVVNGPAVNLTASGMMEISGALIKLN